MCGITGFWTSTGLDDFEAVIDAMTDTMVPRGPDGRGSYTDPQAGVALGHRRLAIIDLSDEGRQPMTSASGRYVISYNGEIYNFEQLRADVRAANSDASFRGHSDTEVLLASIEAFGLVETVERANGMFAFALWDRDEETLHLGRDRLGIKPLYYGTVAGGLIFGSELQPLTRHPRFTDDIDRRALADLLRYNSIPAPRSIYRDLSKLIPGSIATFDAPEAPARIQRYWNPRRVAERGLTEPFEGTAKQVVDELERQLTKAVSHRMIADVPLGAFLSGGVDSSTVVALMQKVSKRPVKTFSIGFREAAYNEATDAKAVAEHLGTDHTERYVTHDDALAVIPKLPTLYDEPFADSSQIPTHLVSQLARESVTVSLSGDGGDELFAGYNRHVWAGRVARLLRLIPSPLRRLIAAGLSAPDPAKVDAAYRKLETLLPDGIGIRIPSEKLQKFAGVLALDGPDQVYDHLRSDWKSPADVVIGLDDATPEHRAMPDGANYTEQMMFADLISYLPDDILTKVDRAAMAVSLESRVPLLDHRVVEFAWRLPLEYKLRDGASKWALRQVLYRHVPPELIERPKMGFGVPLEHWLRGPLRDWAEELLAPHRLRNEGYLHPEPIRKLWQEHLDGHTNHHHRLWNVLMFQAWLGAGRQPSSPRGEVA